MKNEKIDNKAKSTGNRKSVVQAMAKQDKEKQKELSKNSQEIQDAIRMKAYEIYLERGAEHGNELQDWIAAEQIVLQKSI